jgi:hypothetical protein
VRRRPNFGHWLEREGSLSCRTLFLGARSFQVLCTYSKKTHVMLRSFGCVGVGVTRGCLPFYPSYLIMICSSPVCSRKKNVLIVCLFELVGVNIFFYKLGQI